MRTLTTTKLAVNTLTMNEAEKSLTVNEIGHVNEFETHAYGGYRAKHANVRS